MKIGNYTVTIGCDPELFIYDTKTKKYVSAHDRTTGTKAKPSTLGPSSAVQADGTALEFNISPAGSADTFSTYVRGALDALRAGYLVPGEVLMASPVATYDDDYFKRLPPQAVELGCSPDFNAYTGMVNPPPDTSKISPNTRTAAGHLAIGWRTEGDLVDPMDPAHFDDCIQLVKMLDILFDMLEPNQYFGSLDKIKYRKNLYGARGAFRPKPWGVEYRVPSNTWLLSHYTIRQMFHMCTYAFEYLMNGPTESGIKTLKDHIDFSRSYMSKCVVPDPGVSGYSTVKDYKYSGFKFELVKHNSVLAGHGPHINSISLLPLSSSRFTVYCSNSVLTYLPVDKQLQVTTGLAKGV